MPRTLLRACVIALFLLVACASCGRTPTAPAICQTATHHVRSSVVGTNDTVTVVMLTKWCK